MLNLSFDAKNDILYIKINDMHNSYGDEIENGLVVFYDMDDESITGVTIFDFIKRLNEGKMKHLKLPCSIDIEKDVLPEVEKIIMN